MTALDEMFGSVQATLRVVERTIDASIDRKVRDRLVRRLAYLDQIETRCRDRLGQSD